MSLILGLTPYDAKQMDCAPESSCDAHGYAGTSRHRLRLMKSQHLRQLRTDR